MGRLVHCFYGQNPERVEISTWVLLSHSPWNFLSWPVYSKSVRGLFRFSQLRANPWHVPTLPFLTLLSCSVMCFNLQVLVSLGASEKLALLSLGNQLLPNSSNRPASVRHCRKLIQLLRPTHSTWARTPGVTSSLHCPTVAKISLFSYPSY